MKWLCLPTMKELFFSDMTLQVKIYPSIEKLTTVNTNVVCTEIGCSSVFTSASNLGLHLAQTHKKGIFLRTSRIVKSFHCPEVHCIYNQIRFFSSLKQLKQHYLKVHKEKTFICHTCDLKFPTQQSQNSHSEFCGVKFRCGDCSSSYAVYESLRTHCRRKKHKIVEKNAFKPTKGVARPVNHLNSILIHNYIPMKKSLEFNVNATVEKESQTDLCQEIPKETKLIQIGDSSPKYTQETQTLGDIVWRPISDMETQTIKHHNQKQNYQLVGCINDKTLSHKCVDTQTKHIISNTKSCNTSFNLEDFDFQSECGERNSSYTQTGRINPCEAFFSISTSTHDSTHTDTADLNFEFVHSSSQTSFTEDTETFNSENYFNCSSETQTDFMLMLGSDLSSDIHTQTCSDELLFDFGLNDTHTQTVFDDVRSVESQTTKTMCASKIGMSYQDMITQTELHSQYFLEEINH